jgi:hypothetical protein
MAISIVNGYLCFSSCDAAKARAGEDPHPSVDASTSRGPAVILDGALGKGTVSVSPADATTKSEAATGWIRKLDLLV